MKVKGLGIRYHERERERDQQRGPHVDHMSVEHGEVIEVVVVVDTGKIHTHEWMDGRDGTGRVIVTIL